MGGGVGGGSGGGGGFWWWAVAVVLLPPLLPLFLPQTTMLSTSVSQGPAVPRDRQRRGLGRPLRGLALPRHGGQ